MSQVDINLEPEFDGISYLVGGPVKENLRFGPREFCLITGFIFDDNTKAKHGGFSFINRVLSENIVIPFSVDSLKTLLEEKEELFEDEDVVRLCLLLLLYSFFMGVETTKLVEQDHLLLVDNLQFWNEYNWGSYLWSRTYPNLLNVLAKKKLHPNKKLYYSLTGFV
ncbi:hypothetical protein E3N88_41982 [Mikania micrantha]|uniref:DUF1985 domain-containing protein n=1 Tax=Mikania micrantha TaxID=192012 RepID=A0A5N6LJ16_9ASTR|nr:hypothetical protein E3N88_41982 [Mikania micrantha]